MPSQHAKEFANELMDIYEGARKLGSTGGIFEEACAADAANPEYEAVTFHIGSYAVTLCPANGFIEEHRPEDPRRFVALGVNAYAVSKGETATPATVSLFVPVDKNNQAEAEIHRSTAFRLQPGLSAHYRASRELSEAESMQARSLVPNVDTKRLFDPDQLWGQLGALTPKEQHAYAAAKENARRTAADAAESAEELADWEKKHRVPPRRNHRLRRHQKTGASHH